MEPEERVGRTVVGRFRVDRIIGRGGMATVYGAVDEKSGAHVAIKLLKRELTRDPTVLKRFEREAKAASALSHRNIIAVHEYGVDGDDAYIVMELANGKDLLKALALERPMRQARAAIILAQVCAALDAAHAKGIVHRDLKPENIVIVPDAAEPGGELAKVLDFGIAKILEAAKAPPSDGIDPPSYVTKTALTRVGTIVGTPAYMSPEQCRGGELDGRSDLYTCGVLLYQLVTGELPFTGETPLHTAMRHIHAQPKPPRELRRNLHEGLERTILKALAKWPGERHQTAAQLRDELLAHVPSLPDRGTIVVPPNYLGAAEAPKPSGRTSIAAQPTRELVGGRLGQTPLMAVRLGAAPVEPPVSAKAEAEKKPLQIPPPPPAAPPDDDDDDVRTFLMAPEQAAPSLENASTASPATSPASAPVTDRDAPQAAEVKTDPLAAEKARQPSPAVLRTERLSDPAIAQKSDTPIAHAKTAPVTAGARLTERSAEAPRAAARSERPRQPASPRRLVKQTETGLTPTSPKQAASLGGAAITPRAGPPAAAALSPPAPAVAPAPIDDDEPSTYVREPPRSTGNTTTLVMEEPQARQAAKELVAVAPVPARPTQASPGSPMAAAPVGSAAPMTSAPTLLAPGNADRDAEALRALKATSRMAPEDAAPAAAAHAGAPVPAPGLNSTVRMDPGDGFPQPGQAPQAPARNLPPTMPGNTPHPLAGSSPGLVALPSGQWNDPTAISKRRDGTPTDRPQKRGGMVGELESLPGTTGFLIGIGLGLGVAAGLVIALFFMRC
jgi:serine/threonine-protein kinase